MRTTQDNEASSAPAPIQAPAPPAPALIYIKKTLDTALINLKKAVDESNDVKTKALIKLFFYPAVIEKTKADELLLLLKHPFIF